MGIFLRHSYNVPPPRWGSSADVQNVVRVNSEKVYGINSDNCVLAMPWFWGFPCLDYSKFGNHGTNYGGLYKKNNIYLNGTSYITAPADPSLDFGSGGFTLSFILKMPNYTAYQNLIGTSVTDSIMLSFYPAGKITIGRLGKAWDTGVTHGLTNGHWVDITLTRIGTNIYFYLNGRPCSENPQANSNSYPQDIVYLGRQPVPSTNYLTGNVSQIRFLNIGITENQAALFADLPYGLYQRVSRPFYLLPTAAEPTAKFNDLNTEISGGSETLQNLITDIQANSEIFFDLQTEISATIVQTIRDLNTEIAAAFNILFEDLNIDIQAAAESLIDLTTDISATTPSETIIDLDTDIQAKSDGIYYDLITDIRANKRLFYDLNTEIAVIRSKYWLDTEIEALSYARWNFNTEWNPNRFLNTEIAAKKPYTFSFKTKTGSSYVASSSEIEILLSGYAWPLRTLFLDYLRVGTSNVYNFELWWSRGQSGKNPLKNAKIKAEYTNTQYSGGYEVVTCDWLSCKIDGGVSQTINATPLDLGDLPCDSKLDIELTVDCRDCSLTRGLVFFRLIVTGDYQEALYGAPIVYGGGAQYFEGEQDDYESNNFICRLYVVG